jgi:maltoporin
MRRHLVPIVALAVVFSFRTATAQTSTNSDVDAIRHEMEQLRQDDAQRMQQLEKRVQELEQSAQTPSTNKPAATSGVTNTAPTPAQRARLFADQEFNEDTGTIDQVLSEELNQPTKERFEHVLNNFMDISGYARAGYGRDNEGGPQVPFQAPGAFAKYRLGNETENYAELAFGKDWYGPNAFSLSGAERPDGTPEGPVARTQVRVAMYNPYSGQNGSSGTTFTFPEAWAAVGNMFAAQPDLKFWAGNRFYRRQDIYIDDFFFYNMSGSGAGVEDLTLPFGKMAFAWIGNGAQSGVYSSDIAALPDPNNLAGFSKQSFDFSLYEVAVPLGKLELGVVYALENSGLDALGVQGPDSHGVSVTAIHTHEHFISEDGFNRVSVQYGTAAAKTFTSGYETISLTNGTFIVPDQPGSWRFRVTENFVVQPTEHWSISPAVVYQYTDSNNSQGIVQWFSAGARPIYHFNDFFSVAFEGGVDYVDDSSLNRNGSLYKLTLAPQISMGGKFFSRPVLRAYVTYAGWGNSFEGAVGGNDYANQTHGWAWGAQMEAWW